MGRHSVLEREQVRASDDEVELPFARVDELAKKAIKEATKTRLRLGSLLGVAVVGSLIGGANLVDAAVGGSSDSTQTLSYTPEAAVLDDCQGASSSRISNALYVGSTSNGSEIWGVPWTDTTGNTHAAYVLEASPTAPKKYLGTYSATSCNWVDVPGSYSN